MEKKRLYPEVGLEDRRAVPEEHPEDRACNTSGPGWDLAEGSLGHPEGTPREPQEACSGGILAVAAVPSKTPGELHNPDEP